MRTLHLLRHAKSDWGHPGLSDVERPLNGRGRRDAKALHKYLDKHPIALDAVFCSPARRARETLEAIAPALGGARLVEEAGLYGAAADELLSFVRDLPDELEAVMLVGHNPGLEVVARALVHEGKAFGTCTLATITFEGADWPAAGPRKGRLASFLTHADFA
ncbi:MAG TPA: histidine phosphatase family protein [Candidatus Dormibacteraeota bacterium]|nr:histidine phosphatase family protein [Candidatus Dormibacteraeota bacterium]